jgi:hypothetical protein
MLCTILLFIREVFLSHIGAIVGGVVALVVLALIAGGVFLWML